MPRHKPLARSSTSSTSNQIETDKAVEMAQSANETAAGQPPAAKRLRVPHLNFSIESMMQPAANQQSQQVTAESCNGTMPAADSRSPSPSSGSDAGSATSGSSSNSISRIAGSRIANGQNQNTANNNHHLTINDTTESLASSRGSSRVSTPISPGCNSNAISANSEQFSAVGVHLHHTSPPPRAIMSNSAAPSKVQMNQQNSSSNNNNNHQAGTSMSQSQQVRATNESGGVGKVSKSSRSGNSRIRPVCTDSRLAPFECHLDNLELWHRFHPLDTEMIITKQGRRMFPPVRVTFSFNDQVLWQQEQEHKATAAAACQRGATAPQFNSRDKYQVLMDILPYDNKRYRYAYHKSSWQQAGKADPPSPTKLFLHPDGPFTLDQLRRQVISFEKIKLTNNDANKHGYIVLNSMHKYQPRIHLILWRGKESQNLVNAPVNLLDMEAHKTFVFSETIFTAVTAYQNHSITKLKIDSNPFAKGFRDSTRLTDLELESMQDLMADGQCPFSPPRAPPPGFPHFLFAAAAAQHPQFGAAYGNPHQPPPPHFTMGGPAPSGMPAQSQQGGAHTPTSKHDDATAALLRERTIMALDSFLQQQQQQSASGPTNSGSPQSALPVSCGGAINNNQGQCAISTSASSGTPPVDNQHHQQQQSSPSITTTAPTNMCQFVSPFGNHQPAHVNFSLPAQQPPVTMVAQQQQQQQQRAPGQLEQFLMQQQQQFAAAMAAAAAAAASQAAGHGPAPPPHHGAYHPLQSLFAQAAAQQQQQQQRLGSPATPTSGNNKLGASPPPPLSVPLTTSATMISAASNQHHHDQTSPIGAAKSAARMLDLSNFLSAPLGGATGGAPPPPGSMLQQGALHPQHLQALIQHHQQQMAALAHHQQQQQQHQNAAACHLSQLQEPQQQQQLLMAETNGAAGGPTSRKTAASAKNK